MDQIRVDGPKSDKQTEILTDMAQQERSNNKCYISAFKY